jgi:hypothetical protein
MPNASKLPKPVPSQTEEWKQLAEKASKEQDPKELMKTIDELCKKLDERLRKPPTTAKP